MGEAAEPTPVKLILGVIAVGRERLNSVLPLLDPVFGPADLSSDAVRFDFTDYYRGEMGNDLQRQFHSFANLVLPGRLAGLKTTTNRLELETGSGDAGGAGRRLNLDPGYINSDQLVLATIKPARHRIYLSDGIYGDLELYFEKKSFRPYQWTYPDYRLTDTIDFFNQVRSIYIEQLRSGEGK